MGFFKNLFGGNRTDWTSDVTNIQKYVKIYKEMMKFWKNKVSEKINSYKIIFYKLPIYHLSCHKT